MAETDLDQAVRRRVFDQVAETGQVPQAPATELMERHHMIAPPDSRPAYGALRTTPTAD